MSCPQSTLAVNPCDGFLRFFSDSPGGPSKTCIRSHVCNTRTYIATGARNVAIASALLKRFLIANLPSQFISIILYILYIYRVESSPLIAIKNGYTSDASVRIHYSFLLASCLRHLNYTFLHIMIFFSFFFSNF